MGFGLLVNAQVVNADETQNVVDSEVVNSSSISNNQVSGGEQTGANATTIQGGADAAISESTTGNATLSTQESESTTSDETKNDVTPRVTPRASVNNQSGYIDVPGVGWRWLENGQNFTGFRKYMGSYYWFQNGVHQENSWEMAWGNKYYVGADGRAVQGIVTINGQKHNFGKNGTFYERPMPTKVNRPTYFSQWDNRWANTGLSGGTFGATGCVPTSAAMVLKGSYGVNVTPRQVGNQVSKFHEAYGASGIDLQTMVNAYGHSAKSLSTPNAFKNELKQGKPVIFFVNVGIGHAVVGYGYKQGKTEIFDPYNQQFYKGWNSVDGVLGRLSQDPQDWDAGTPAFVIN